uniref:Uncharacterized protein n=1 Tax=Arundo donax TaxID=35708 RepID=A0A0A8XMU0_ARUDO
MDVWCAVQNEAKWTTYNNELKKARKRKASDQVEGREEIDPVDNDERPRPMGQKQAKRPPMILRSSQIFLQQMLKSSINMIKFSLNLMQTASRC